MLLSTASPASPASSLSTPTSYRDAARRVRARSTFRRAALEARGDATVHSRHHNPPTAGRCTAASSVSTHHHQHSSFRTLAIGKNNNTAVDVDADVSPSATEASSSFLVPALGSSSAAITAGDAATADAPASALQKFLSVGLPVLGVVALIAVGFSFKSEIAGALNWFVEYIDSLGQYGYLVFMGMYIVLEVFSVPAVPLSMSAGVLFGPVQGTLMVTTSATIAATISFCIARFVARDKVREMAKDNPKFAAIDRAIGNDSFRIVALLRLSPLLPFAIANYFYGLTSVKLQPYILASWLGMIPGTFAYVSAGSVGRSLMESGGAGPGQIWQAAAGLGVAIVSGTYVARVASKALEEAEAENGDDDTTASDASRGGPPSSP